MSNRVKARDVEGFTLVELLMVVAIVGIISAIAVPGLLRSRMSGQEASGIGSLRAVNAAESIFASSCGGNGYAQSLDDLARPPIGATQGFLSPDLSMNGVIKSGYAVNLSIDAGASVVLLAVATCNGSSSDSVSSYFSEAHPASSGFSGQRAFGTDSRGSIYFNTNGTTIAPGMAGASPLQ